MKIVKINGADIYIDGGSYGFWFDCEDGNKYEFFIKRDLSEGSKNDYLPPVICQNRYTRNSVVKEFEWLEAQDYLSKINYEDTHFEALVEIVKNNGKYRLK
jgi:hypothetical protein